jgi:hypothetical protein
MIRSKFNQDFEWKSTCNVYNMTRCKSAPRGLAKMTIYSGTAPTRCTNNRSDRGYAVAHTTLFSVKTLTYKCEIGIHQNQLTLITN